MLKTKCITQYGRMVCKINKISKAGFYVVDCSFVNRFNVPGDFLAPTVYSEILTTSFNKGKLKNMPCADNIGCRPNV